MMSSGGNVYGDMRQASLDKFHNTVSGAKGWLTPNEPYGLSASAEAERTASDKDTYNATVSGAHSQLSDDMRAAHGMETWKPETYGRVKDEPDAVIPNF